MEFEWGQFLAIALFAFLAGMIDAIAGGGGLIQFPAFFNSISAASCACSHGHQ